MTTEACSQNIGKLFSELKLLTDNLLIMQKPTEKSLNPLSLNVADLQHLGIELFCGFSLYNAFRPSSESITVSLLVLPLSQALVIEAG